MYIDYSKLGERISTRRREMNLKQYVLAEKAGIANNYLSNIERGRSIPSLEVFVSLCNALNTTPDNFLLGVGKSDNIPLRITENLKLCDHNSLELIDDYVQLIVEKQNKGKK